MNERGQYGARPLRVKAECGKYGQYDQYGHGVLRAVAHLALHVAGILLVGLGLAYLLIRWSSA